MPRSAKDVYHMNWALYERLVHDLAEQLRERLFVFNSFRIDTVYGVPRGGTILAAYLSHITGLQYAHVFPVNPKTPDKRVLIVDDIVDAGVTMRPYVEFGWPTATLVLRQGCPVQPWICADPQPLASGIHLRFPYETPTSTYGGRGE